MGSVLIQRLAFKVHLDQRMHRLYSLVM